MNLFDVLNDIFSDKKGILSEDQNFENSVQSSYMLQRWVSMKSEMDAFLVNETTNKCFYAVENDPELLYKLYVAVVPKSNRSKFTYIKKEKKVVNEEREQIIDFLANTLNLSNREINNYITEFNLDIDSYKKYIK